MIVIGVDTHKRTHTLAAMNASTGTVCGERTIVASDAGSLEALRFVRGLDEQRVWAIEDCRHVSGRIERALVAAGERVIRIPPAMTATSRRVQRRAGKSDPIDATAVALAALREGARKARVERAAGLSSSACSSGSARFALAWRATASTNSRRRSTCSGSSISSSFTTMGNARRVLGLEQSAVVG